MVHRLSSVTFHIILWLRRELLGLVPHLFAHNLETHLAVECEGARIRLLHSQAHRLRANVLDDFKQTHIRISPAKNRTITVQLSFNVAEGGEKRS